MDYFSIALILDQPCARAPLQYNFGTNTHFLCCSMDDFLLDYLLLTVLSTTIAMNE